jgi:hypothetical protein
MSIWSWIREFEREAAAAGDRDRMLLAQLHGEAYGHRQHDPDRMLALMEQGRRLAVALSEPWWVLFYEHWKVETLIYYKDDYRQVIDLAVKSTLELRKPGFEHFPLRFGVYCNLVAAYLCVDPRGHTESIRSALDYLATQVAPGSGDRYLLQARRHWFAYEMGRLEEADALALEELAMAESDPDRHTALHHEVDTWKALCWIAYRRGDWQALADRACAGEEQARLLDYQYELALFLLWQAACERRAGQEDRARRLARQGAARMARLGQPPGESYFDAVAAYHELAQDYETAWKERCRELTNAAGKGQLAYECLIRLKCVRLLLKRNQPVLEEAEAAREAAAKLRAPQWYLGELERILAGGDNDKDRRV